LPGRKQAKLFELSLVGFVGGGGVVARSFVRHRLLAILQKPLRAVILLQLLLCPAKSSILSA